jgi:energy-converting hydrogenase Eha subunit B
MAKRNAVSGGFFIMLGAVGGAVGGMLLGAPIEGLLGGTAIGVVAAVLIWLLDRRRA